VRAYYEVELPPRDSIRSWLTQVGNYWVVEPTLGTGTSLVATRDFELIGDDSIRTVLPRYLTAMTAFELFEDKWNDDFIAARVELMRQVDVWGLRLEMSSPGERTDSLGTFPLFPLPAGPVRALPLVDIEALVRNDDVHRILLRMNEAKTRMRVQRNRMKRETEKFLGLLELAIAG
jgi:hypothetical protein